jgi:hypothetical protein
MPPQQSRDNPDPISDDHKWKWQASDRAQSEVDSYFWTVEAMAVVNPAKLKVSCNGSGESIVKLMGRTKVNWRA